MNCARFPALLVLLSLPLLGLLAPTGAEAGPQAYDLVVTRTSHLLIRARAPEGIVESLAAVGDELVPALLAHFGQERFRGGPPPPFRIDVHADRAHFEAAVKGLHPKAELEGLGGYTSWTHKTAHLFLQTSRFETRRVFLHELVHLVHDHLLRRGVRQRTPNWYLEGLAEHFGWHRRTRQGVRFGVLDALAVQQRPLLAKRRVREKAWDAWTRITGETKSDYTDAVALFEGLRGSPHAGIREAFRNWEREHVRRNFGDRELVRALRPHRAAIGEALRSFWSAVVIEWTTRSRRMDEENGWIQITPRRPPAALPDADAWRRLLPADVRTGPTPLWFIQRDRSLAEGGAIRWILQRPPSGGICWPNVLPEGKFGRDLYLVIMFDTVLVAPDGARASNLGWHKSGSFTLSVAWSPEGLVLDWQQGERSGRHLLKLKEAENLARIRDARPWLFMSGWAPAMRRPLPSGPVPSKESPREQRKDPESKKDRPGEQR